MRLPAIKFRNKIYVAGPFHQDAINLMIKGMSKLTIIHIYDRIIDEKEDIIFGYAEEDGENWITSDSQNARKYMYGFR